MLKNNKECENLFGLSSDVNINEVSIPSLKVLEHKKFKKELLGAFVACRLLKYTDEKFNSKSMYCYVSKQFNDE